MKEETKTEQSGCLFYLPDENAFIDGLLDTLPFRRHSVFFFLFLLSFLSPPQPAAGGQLVKSAAVCGVIKIIQVLLRSPGLEGGAGLSGRTAQFTSHTQKESTLLLYWETQGRLEMVSSWRRSTKVGVLTLACGGACESAYGGTKDTLVFLRLL